MFVLKGTAMKAIEISEDAIALVTQMRPEGPLGLTAGQLEDGNMLTRLCEFAGVGACAQVCQRKADGELNVPPKACAEQNLTEALTAEHITPENFAMVSATADRIGFADELQGLGAARHEDGYTTVPGCNAFFFRPSKDITLGHHRQLTHAGMRMADCGAVCYTFPDQYGNEVVGIAHFSRTNMRGPSAYIHEVDGEKVSWAEYVLANAVRHYGADPGTVKVTLAAAVEGRDFIHHYKDKAAMNGHYPGWEELGFMHPQGEQDFDCLIDYREMIEWQLTESMQNPALRLDAASIATSQAINTGDLRLGHASHHAAGKGLIPHGRDMYVVGLDTRALGSPA
jgi:hypothetical protein